jgi:antitoxin (DNA-binding transcriptional repressor) of toxin-antitoxin stability system
MSTVVSAVDARRSMGTWINTVVLKHEDVIIERSGKPVARLTSCDTAPTDHAKKGLLDLRSARGLGQELWQNIDVAAYIAEERAQWE